MTSRHHENFAQAHGLELAIPLRGHHGKWKRLTITGIALAEFVL